MAGENQVPPSFDPPPGVDTSAKIPLQSAVRLSERDVIERTRRFFGYPVVAVELTEEHYTDSLEEAKQWWVDNWGPMRFRMFDLVPGIREIQMTDDVVEVQDVNFEGMRMPPLVFERDFPFFAPFPSGVGTGGMVFSYPTALYSVLVQQFQMIGQIKRIFSAESDWEFDNLTKVLRLFGGGSSGDRRMIVEYLSNSVQIEELTGEALITFIRYFRSECKERLGQIRSKYDSIPVAGGSASLNGAALLEQANDEKEKLTEWAHQRNYPYRFLRG